MEALAVAQAQGAESTPDTRVQETPVADDAMDLELTETAGFRAASTGAMEAADGIEQPTTVLERANQTGTVRVDTMTTNAPQPVQQSALRQLSPPT